MGSGMVRKVDELGRVVLPKEMRRILNIKPGSSIEMSINEDNQVVLKKFSELSNVLYFAENLANIVFDELNLQCILTDEENVLICKGVLKKDFLDKKLLNDLEVKKNFLELQNKPFLQDQKNSFDFTYIFPITSEGYNNGYLIVLKDKEKLNEIIIEKIKLLTLFLSDLLKF